MSWIPLFQILEAAGEEVCLVNARRGKNLPGRRSDVRDCQWLQYLHAVGLLPGSFRPADEVCGALRHRDGRVKGAPIAGVTEEPLPAAGFAQRRVQKKCPPCCPSMKKRTGCSAWT